MPKHDAEIHMSTGTRQEMGEASSSSSSGVAKNSKLEF